MLVIEIQRISNFNILGFCASSGFQAKLSLKHVNKNLQDRLKTDCSELDIQIDSIVELRTRHSIKNVCLTQSTPRLRQIVFTTTRMLFIVFISKNSLANWRRINIHDSDDDFVFAREERRLIGRAQNKSMFKRSSAARSKYPRHHQSSVN